MQNQDTVGVTFVNLVAGRGTFNGVVNLSFATLNFTPNTETGEIESDPVISCRLRMDLVCAKQLLTALQDLVKSIEVAAVPTDEIEHTARPN